MGKKIDICNGNSFVNVGHSYKLEVKPFVVLRTNELTLMCHSGLLGWFYINVWSSSLKAMIAIPNMKHSCKEPTKMQILDQEFLKLCIIFFPKTTPSINIIAHIFFFTLLVCWGNIKCLLTFLITHEECLLHLEHVELQSRPNNWHGEESTQRDTQPCFILWEDFVLVLNLQSIQLILMLNYLYGPLAIGLAL